MSVTLFGSCRIWTPKSNDLNNLTTFTHTTKEVIQLIKFLTGELHIPEPYNKLCFRTGIDKNVNISYRDTMKQLYLDTEVFIIEICSNKKYIHNGFYLHHSCVDKRIRHSYKPSLNTPQDILDTYTIEVQTEEEIKNDLIEIQKIIPSSKLVIITHYNSKCNGEYLKSRNDLINLVEKICNELKIFCINPTNALWCYSQEYIMTDDLGHYLPFGKEKIVEHITNYINENFA
jgi:hypothetical protein